VAGSKPDNRPVLAHEIWIELSRQGPRRIHGHAGDKRNRIKSTCHRHGVTDFALRSNGYYRCLRCSSEAVLQWRRRTRERLVRKFGGACVLCGFDQLAALEFHHLDPSSKSFGLAARGITRSFASLCEEARKCVLLCSNCHAQVEAGTLVLPAHVAANLSRQQES